MRARRKTHERKMGLRALAVRIGQVNSSTRVATIVRLQDEIARMNRSGVLDNTSALALFDALNSNRFAKPSSRAMGRRK